MKWIMISKPTDTVHVFNLMDQDTIKEVLRYNPSQQSARINNQQRQRLFFIEQPGFKNNHFVFKNEYGFDTGRLSFDSRNNKTGILEMEERKIYFTLSGDTTAEIVLYEENGLQPLLTCFLQHALDKKDILYAYASIILGLCWYQFGAPHELALIGAN
jgi:hypothetical protein